MRSRAPKQAESEFDDLLGQLTDELAMTPASDSGVSLVPDVDSADVDGPTARIANAGSADLMYPVASSKPDNTMVKIVGIITASLTVVSIAALVVFGTGRSSEEPGAVEDHAAVATTDRNDAADAAKRQAEREAHARALGAERAAEQAKYARFEAQRLSAELAAKARAETKPKRKKPRPKKPKPDVGDDFDSL
jgi:hypothetical protein